jgi:hypothetical protein
MKSKNWKIIKIEKLQEEDGTKEGNGCIIGSIMKWGGRIEKF